MSSNKILPTAENEEPSSHRINRLDSQISFFKDDIYHVDELYDKM